MSYAPIEGDKDGDRILDAVNSYSKAYSFGGEFVGSQPTVVVIHCTEGPLNDAVAESLMGPNWFGGPQAGTSCHFTGDSNSIVQGVPLHRIAYHCGNGNIVSIGFEFCGRVAMSKAEWRSPAAMEMLHIQAPRIAEVLKYCNATPRWLSLTQLNAGERGMCTHNDMRLTMGGTTHSDPGPNFPYDELMALVKDAFYGKSTAPKAPTSSTPVPTPTPTPTPEEEVATIDWTGTPKAERDALLQAVRDYAVEAASGPTPGGSDNTVKDAIWRLARVEDTLNKVKVALDALVAGGGGANPQ